MRAVIYARYSAGPNQTDQSIEGQLRVCKKFIKEKDFKLTHEYIDRHISGRTDQRPAFQEMISDSEAGKFDVLVLYNSDRFARNKYDSVMYKKKLRDNGVKIFYAAENIPDTPEGVLLESLMEGWAEYYSEELSRKIKRGMHDTARKGKVAGSTPPPGYLIENQQYIKNPLFGNAISEVFDIYVKGGTIKECVAHLNNKGLRNFRGKPFDHNAVKRLLANEKYTGSYKFLGVDMTSPRLVSDEVFELAQEKIKGKKHPRPHEVFLLTGKLFCGCCGSPMKSLAGTSKTGKVHQYYACKKKDQKNVQKEWLEELVVNEVKKVFTEPTSLDMVAHKLFMLEQEENATRDELDAVKARINSIDIELNNLINVLASGVSSDAIINKVQELESEKYDLTESIKTIKPISEETLRAGLELVLDKGTNKQLIDTFVYKVTIWPDKILIEFNITHGDGLLNSEFNLSADCSTRTRSVELYSFSRMSSRFLYVYILKQEAHLL